MPDDVADALNDDGAETFRLELPGEAHTSYGDPFTKFAGVYEWNMSHWTYRAGIEFCERGEADHNDRGWLDGVLGR
ncbi:MAG: hypothetical protein OXU77_21355 [Gammaproteobacteria bacterium]|nr:hypothetical protein [Gammaproteobacteria bacterium]